MTLTHFIFPYILGDAGDILRKSPRLVNTCVESNFDLGVPSANLKNQLVIHPSSSEYLVKHESHTSLIVNRVVRLKTSFSACGPGLTC